MSFCPNCGTALEEGTRFCSSCGHSLQSATPAPRKTSPRNSRRMHCPECQSHNISPVVETEITSGTSFNHSFSKRNSVSAMQFNNTHRNYWMCSDCGCKFRNIQNLEEEIKTTQNLVKRGIAGIILLAVLSLFFVMTIGFGGFTILMILVILLTVAAIIILKNRISSMEQERSYLKKRCFN